MRTKPVLFLTIVGGLLLSGCGSVKIGRINADPTRFHNKTVRVDGRVTNSVGAFVVGAYQVEDDTGKIYVVSNTGAPAKGSQVHVKGTVKNGITFGNRSFGTVIQESGHKVRY